MSVANQRSTPVGAKVNGSHNHAEQRCFALLSMTNNIWVNFYINALIFNKAKQINAVRCCFLWAYVKPVEFQ